MAQSKIKTQDLGSRTRNLVPRTQDLQPRTRDPGHGTWDLGLKTHASGPRTPKSGTPVLWTFLLNFKIKRWKVRNHLQVNVITQSILLLVKQLHDIAFCGVELCFLETYKFNKCTMQELSIVDFVFYVITFVLAYLINYLNKIKENVSPPISFSSCFR